METLYILAAVFSVAGMILSRSLLGQLFFFSGIFLISALLLVHGLPPESRTTTKSTLLILMVTACFQWGLGFCLRVAQRFRRPAENFETMDRLQG